MANSVSKIGQVVSVTFDGAEDFDLAGFLGFAPGLVLRKMVFFPFAAGDTVTVREVYNAGPIIAKLKDAAGEGLQLDFPGRFVCHPVVKGSEVTAGSIISFIYE
jgi:hypothetical protein